MKKQKIIELSLYETDEKTSNEENKLSIDLNFEKSKISLEKASYEVLSSGIALVSESIRRQGRKPTRSEVLAIVIQAFNEQ